jgi:glycosyltransferase involved in cell wall biosynthesis
MAVSSVLNQTFKDFEVIVVDDASADNTKEFVQGFNDGRIRYAQHETNRGVAAARNTGLSSSKGKYIAFLDDDDEWLPHKLERQVNALEKSPFTTGAVYSGFYKIEKPSGKLLAEVTTGKRGQIFVDLLFHNYVATSTVLIRKECFEAAGSFDVTLRYMEDYDMWLRISKEWHFEFLEEPLMKYSLYKQGGLSSDRKTVIEGCETHLSRYSHLLASDKKNYSQLCLSLGVLYCYNGNLEKGRQLFLRAIALYPFDARHYLNLLLSLLGVRGFRYIKELKERASNGARVNLGNSRPNRLTRTR